MLSWFPIPTPLESSAIKKDRNGRACFHFGALCDKKGWFLYSDKTGANEDKVILRGYISPVPPDNAIFFSFDSLMKRKQQAYSLNGKTVSISSKKGKKSHNAAATKVRREQVARFKFSEQAVKRWDLLPAC